jgi:hypothetical protein
MENVLTRQIDLVLANNNLIVSGCVGIFQQAMVSDLVLFSYLK